VCGISGDVRATPQVDSAAVRRMHEVLTHRGPDDDDVVTLAHIAIGVRRLSIVDASGAAQPLSSEDGTVSVVANGEIYNFEHLRAGLLARGHRFRSAGDCEVIPHLYEEKGAACVHLLRGMFAFALWDARRRRLLLARDRLGEKPLYMYEQDGRLIFASELKALLASGAIPFVLDPVSLDRYFHMQYVPEPATPILGVRKLPAAHVLEVDVSPWRVRERRYWHMEAAEPLVGRPATAIRRQLEEVGRLVARADVPVGVALSGGLDSSAVAALIAAEHSGPATAFTVGYADHPKEDERAEAARVAQAVGLEFCEVELTQTDAVELLPEVVMWADDPIADLSGVGYYAVMRAARAAGVRVMFQGQGGDELFWGYEWVRRARCRAQGQRADIATLYAGKSDFLQARAAADRAYARGFRERLALSRAAAPLPLAGDADCPDIRFTRLICESYLLENGIAQGDRLAMASSMELRLPLVDHRFVETVIGLRKTSSDLELPPKTWLRSALAGMLPPNVLSRPKRPFATPAEAWYPALFAAYGRLVQDGALVEAAVLTPQAGVRINRREPSPGVVTRFAYKAIVLELWCRCYGSLLGRAPVIA
jgi:asparagine synthase (glutamine-hydrolysing)